MTAVGDPGTVAGERDPDEPAPATGDATDLGVLDGAELLRRYSRDAVVVIDTAGCITWTSPAQVDLLGYEPEALLGTGAFSYLHPDDLGPAMQRAAEAYASDTEVEPAIARIRRADGTWRHVELAAGVLEGDGEPGPDGRPPVAGVVLNLRDAEARMAAEAALRHSEERFRTLVQHSTDAVIVIDEATTITYASPAVENLFGRSPEEFLGTTGVSFVHPDDSDRIASMVEVIEAPGRSLTREVRVLDNQERWRWAEATATNLLDDEHVQGIVIHVRDVSERRAAEEALRDSEQLFRSLAQSSPTGIYRQDETGRCVYVNERWQEITGLTADEALGDGWRRIVHPDDRAWLGVDREPGSSEPTPLQAEFRVVRPNGETRWVAIRTAALVDDGGNRQGNVGTLEDITDRIEAQRDNQRLIDIFEATNDLVGIADPDGRLLYLNQASRRFFDLPEHGGLDGLNLVDKLPPSVVDRLEPEIVPLLDRDGMWSGELSLVRADDALVPVLAQLLVHRDAEGRMEFFSAVMHDISERKEFESALAHQATHDPLTGLPNRTLLLDRLGVAIDRAVRRGGRVAVLFLDLDHFKVVNDSLGHALGDRLLVAIAERLKVALRPDDTIARFGGDEFVVLCEELHGRADAIAIADRVNAAVSGPFVIDDVEVFVGMSIGIAFPDRLGDDLDPATLIRDADAAMYRAKERGRGRWEVFDNAMRASAVDRLDIENALRRAIERRELRVFYQPVVHLGTGGIVGVEALLRWEHGERGLLLPGDFITVAEETGLIVPFGTWVLEQACRQLVRWQTAHPDLPRLSVAVNLSGRQLGHPKLVDDIGEVLSDTGIDPAQVELEITESVLMDDVEMSEETLQRLKALGVRLAVDDFGTGYSSLSYLRRFPVDLLKVDRSFVDGLGSDPSDSAIAAAVITLAHTLGLEAVAEGVETETQLAELRRLECDTAQGFLLARPAPGDVIGELLASRPTW
ncbi:MAG: EAL domain-containing protein [Acidimicrobiales bacterium]